MVRQARLIGTTLGLAFTLAIPGLAPAQQPHPPAPPPHTSSPGSTSTGQYPRSSALSFPPMFGTPGFHGPFWAYPTMTTPAGIPTPPATPPASTPATSASPPITSPASATPASSFASSGQASGPSGSGGGGSGSYANGGSTATVKRATGILSNPVNYLQYSSITGVGPTNGTVSVYNSFGVLNNPYAPYGMFSSTATAGGSDAPPGVMLSVNYAYMPFNQPMGPPLNPYGPYGLNNPALYGPYGYPSVYGPYGYGNPGAYGYGYPGALGTFGNGFPGAMGFMGNGLPGSGR